MGAAPPENLPLRLPVQERHIGRSASGSTPGNIHRPSDLDSAISIPSSNSDNGDGEEQGRKHSVLSSAVPMCSTDTDNSPASEHRLSFADSAVSTASSPVSELEKVAAPAEEGNQASKQSTEHSLASFDPDRTIGGTKMLSEGENYFGFEANSIAIEEYLDSRVSVDGGADRLYPTSLGVSRLSPGPQSPTTPPMLLTRAVSPRLSPGYFTATPLSITRSVSQDDSVIAIDDGQNNDGWDPTTLLEFSDALRQVLHEFTIPGNKLKDLDALLGLMLSDERYIDRAVDLNVIVHAHWDKLLHDLLSYQGRLEQSDDQLKELLSKASSLEHRWQQRFKTGYFAIDDERLATLKNGEGLLQDVILDSGDRQEGHKWLVRRTNPISKHPGDLSFRPGDWWLSMFCAYRDGIVSSPDERLTNGPYGVTALPLLMGREVEGETLGTFKYIKEGPSSEMHFRLLSNFSRHIRVLRGYNLDSPYAPVAGIRYDGLYKVKHYGHVLADAEKDIYRCVITLERLGGQTSFNEIRTIPTPSQLDDWLLYNKLMGDDIRAREGDVAYSKWKTLEDQQEKARDMRRIREEWHRQRNFRAGLEHTGCPEPEKCLEEE